jgi:hypothetical protein
MISPLSLENTPRPIEEGDAGVVLTRSGKFFVFNTHADFDAEQMTDRQIEQAKIITAFSVALQLPAVMEVLMKISTDPKIVGEVNLGTAN